VLLGDVITLVVLVVSVADLVTLLFVGRVTLFVVDRLVDCFVRSLALETQLVINTFDGKGWDRFTLPQIFMKNLCILVHIVHKNKVRKIEKIAFFN
jgi:hypothetical protein